MALTGRYTLIVGRFVALILLLTSAGFTTVLHICTMSTSEVCSLRSPEEGASCECMGATPASGSETYFSSGCSKSALAGGFIAIQAPLEKTLTIAQDFLAYTPYSPSAIVIPDVQFSAQITSLVASENASQDAVEKYVFTATFLI